MTQELRNYLIVTGNYWVFTITDGALRMLVVLHFHQLGYSPLDIALLFLFYEIFGVITNLVGGWLGSRIGLNNTMNIGLAIQIVALSMLLVPQEMLTVVWVMAAQALSGIAKDLNKMSAKSAIKTLVKDDQNDRLLIWVARLTGSKNSLKGLGFFLGGLLLSLIGFQNTVLSMVVGLIAICAFSVALLRDNLGKTEFKQKFSSVFSRSATVNRLAAARLFLFASRDVWFVVAIPVYLSQVHGWSHTNVGILFATWVIAYGLVQATTPQFLSASAALQAKSLLLKYGFLLILTCLALTILVASSLKSDTLLIVGLLFFGGVFAINSALHSFLIVAYADADNVSMDVGFYYMANAVGRLLGTVLSGWVYQMYGIAACLAAATGLSTAAYLLSLRLYRPK